MPRDEHDREDLLAEATALVERLELALPGQADHLVAGFRRDGGLSLYFGADPVYQFNPQGQLRRAFVTGRIYKADCGRLAVLDRRREAGQVVLLRHDLTDAEQAAFLAEMRAQLNALASDLAAGRQRTVGQTPPDADVVGRLRNGLATVLTERAVASSARAGGLT